MQFTEQHCCYVIMALLAVSIILLSVILYKGSEENYAVVQQVYSQTSRGRDPCSKFKPDNSLLNSKTGQRSGKSCTANPEGQKCFSTPLGCASKNFSRLGPVQEGRALTR